MTWEEIVEKQTKEYAAHLESVKKSHEQLMTSKQAVLSTAKCSEPELQPALKDMLQLNEQNWDKEYGMYGTKFKDMRVKQQRELDNFFKHHSIVQDLSKPKEKSKDKSAER